MKCFKRWWNKKAPDKIEIPPLPDYIEGEEIIDFEYEIIKLINDHRRGSMYPISILKENRTLNKIATFHSIYMAERKEASHDNFPRRSKWCKEYASAISVKEITASGYGTAKGVFNAWLNSPSHKEAIEWKKSVEYGISVEEDIDGRNYFTVIFISK